MKNVILSFTIFFFVSCKNDNNLVEVQIPEPEVIVENQITYSNPEDFKSETGPFELINFKYKFDVFEPNLNGKKLENHYSIYYLDVTNQLNKIINEKKEFHSKVKIEDILKNATTPELKNVAGSYYNHSLFFKNLAPKSNFKPSDTLTKAIIKDFGSLELFKENFINTATNHIGSGWTWLLVNSQGKLIITQTNNNDNPLMKDAIIKGYPLLTIDTWEHAYYPQFQNKKTDYLNNVFQLIDWKSVSEIYASEK
uniref:superoxide dismutase n=1 Tax=Flavobacterium sp. TaxID=239 RepID=UPI00404B6604